MKKDSFQFRTVDKPGPVPKYVLEDYRWADSHHTELAKRFPEQWIAIINKKVVAHGNRMDQVLAKAYRFTQRPDIAVHFVESRIHLY